METTRPSSSTQCWLSPGNNPPQIPLILLKQQIRAATSDGEISAAYLPPFQMKYIYILLRSEMFDLCVEDTRDCVCVCGVVRAPNAVYIPAQFAGAAHHFLRLSRRSAAAAASKSL